MTKYLIDANIFIEAHRNFLPIDVATSFWGKMQELASIGKIHSIDKVRNELCIHNDDLKKWIENKLDDNFFWNTTDEVLLKIGEIVQWVQGCPEYNDTAKSKFVRSMDKADVYLVAFASLDTDTRIVTRELSNLKGSNNQVGLVKIPDLCNHFNATYIHPAQMFRELGETF